MKPQGVAEPPSSVRRFADERSLFLKAVEIEGPAERAAFVAEACGEDGELREAVLRLLREHDRDDCPWDRPAAAGSIPPASIVSRLRGELGGASGDVAALLPRERSVGETVGPYRLREQIGEGGFGLVFVADQLRPVRRRVALKVIRPGMQTGEIAARFEAERQALAMMDHPNIARVFDAGVTDDGLPYFAMELVRGVSLTEFCDANRLDLRGRLDLFVAICQAVQHAHQKGVVHRDLKPSNVLVTQQDGRPLPKVIDFGIVKAVGPGPEDRLTDRTIYTGFKAMMGTPAYMSPEQAEMTSGEVDTRSDIYSLGVLLYELLTGATPFAGDRLREAGLIEFRRILLEEEPPPPSGRLGTLRLAEATTVAANRRLEPTRLTSALRGDLDWVVMKALEKDRGRRYPTAIALAEDVTRFVEGLPVEARPPSRRYRFSKFARRHAVALSTAAVVAAALIVGTGVSVWQASVARAALAQARLAEAEAGRSRDELEGFTERLRQATELLGKARALADAGDRAAALRTYDQAARVQPRYFAVWAERGAFFARLGLWDRAAADFAQARTLGAPATGAEFLGVPQLFVLTGRHREYRAIAEAMAAGGAPLGGIYEQTELRGRLAGPLSQREAAVLAAAAERLVEAPPPEDAALGFDDRGRIPRGVKLYIAGWAHLRAGNLDRAIERLEQAGANRGWRGHGLVAPLLALAHSARGRGEQTRAAFAASERVMEDYLAEAADRADGMPSVPWFDWAEFLLFHRAAAARVGADLTELDERLEALRLRTLAGLE
ncbi:protein kinase [Alienimonas sp. DA493]|uniref:serine/threonine-protein kinase n=1 Tax=Alienimonas sp. DA493 TaxID=3373605 RepID=UPI0037540F1B